MPDELAQAIDGWRRVTTMLLAAARAIDAAAWALPSANPGWTNKDMLVHLATGYVQRLTLLDAIATHGTVGALPDADHANAARLAEFRDASIDAICDTLLARREEVEQALRRLRPEHLDITVAVNGRALPLGDYIRDLSRHDLDHLADLQRTAGG